MRDDWFSRLTRPERPPDLRNGTWKLHPLEEEQFFAEYVPREFLTELARAGAIGWREAVESGLKLLSGYVAEYTRDYFLEPYRSDFVESLSLVPGVVVLDLGCGWGFASQRCLEKGACVVGTEAASYRLDFCHTRFIQQGFGDRFVGVEMDANRAFPFKPEVFDAIIVSGLLEWLACSKPGRPDLIQREFMDRCFRALKPGGRLYLAIENRYWWKYFFGAKDLHTFQRFASILPRRFARAASLMATGEDYRAYTYSMLGYLRLFRRAGFDRLDAVYPDPDYVQPKKVKPLFAALALKAPMFRVARSLVRQRPCGFATLFGRSFMFTAVK